MNDPLAHMSRRPKSVYNVGSEPDPRFTMANERTFLAWIRTVLAVMAAGVAVDAFADDLQQQAREIAAVTCVVAGIVGAVGAFFRWMAIERALRRSEPLPGISVAAGVVVVLVGVGLVLVLALVL